MRRQLSTAVFLIALLAVTSCSSSDSGDYGGIRVVAQQDVMLSDDPLGDVVVGRLGQGAEVTAWCFVRRAQTNAGFVGSAIKVTTEDLAAYAAVTDFPEDPSDRQTNFDLDEETLRDRLPACPRRDPLRAQRNSVTTNTAAAAEARVIGSHAGSRRTPSARASCSSESERTPAASRASAIRCWSRSST
jgi:hypothetical protein